MSNATQRSLDRYADEMSSKSAPLLISVPDAERLMIQSRFVRNQFEAEILGDLETRILAAKLLEPFAVPPDLVTMNSQVVLRDTDTNCPHVLTVVFPACANPRKGRISVLSPVGSILLGARTGQTLICPISGLMTTVAVEAILHQPEAAGNLYG